MKRQALQQALPGIEQPPALPPELLARMKALGITLVKVQWSTYWGEWHYFIRACWNRRKLVTTLTKTYQGIVATVEEMERQHRGG